MNTSSRSQHLGMCLLAGMFLAGCTYDASQLNDFLQQPRRPVAGLKYRVMPPDALAIRSQHVVEINGITQRVRPDGKLNLPLLGELYVAGMTPKEIEQAITNLASNYYERVDATVDVAGYNSQKYFIMGEVGSPGPRAWTGHDTLLDALAQAQPTFLAWSSRIKVVRGSCPQEGGYIDEETSGKYRRSGVHPETPEHPRQDMTINLMAMVKSGDMANNILLMPNDIIYVPPHPLAKVGMAIQSLLFPVRPAAEAVQSPATLTPAVP